MKLTLEEVKAALESQTGDRAIEAGAQKWEAEETSVSDLPEHTQERILGARPSAKALELVKTGDKMMAAPPQTGPNSIDWRNVGGINHVSPVRDQGGCGSCVSHGCCGVLESVASITLGRKLDLSEADSHFCSAHGADCSGWWPDECFNEIQGRGVCRESAFPYASAFPSNDIWNEPPVCVAHAHNGATIAGWVGLATAAQCKSHILNFGPLAGCMTVYEDFYYYKSGIYRHVTGENKGGHCILVIGFSDPQSCWICKNSWNEGWGEQGFFRISYKDMKFGGEFYPMYGVTSVIVPWEAEEETPEW